MRVRTRSSVAPLFGSDLLGHHHRHELRAPVGEHARGCGRLERDPLLGRRGDGRGRRGGGGRRRAGAAARDGRRAERRLRRRRGSGQRLGAAAPAASAWEAGRACTRRAMTAMDKQEGEEQPASFHGALSPLSFAVVCLRGRRSGRATAGRPRRDGRVGSAAAGRPRAGPPRQGPCLRRASRAYSEQVGVNRQDAGQQRRDAPLVDAEQEDQAGASRRRLPPLAQAAEAAAAAPPAGPGSRSCRPPASGGPPGRGRGAAAVLPSPVDLFDPALEPVADHRVADLAAGGDPEAGMPELVRERNRGSRASHAAGDPSGST